MISTAAVADQENCIYNFFLIHYSWYHRATNPKQLNKNSSHTVFSREVVINMKVQVVVLNRHSRHSTAVIAW